MGFVDLIVKAVNLDSFIKLDNCCNMASIPFPFSRRSDNDKDVNFGWYVKKLINLLCWYHSIYYYPNLNWLNY